MENSIPIPAETTEKCTACFAHVIPNDSFCDSCGYPLKGTEVEQRYFLSQQGVDSIDYADYNKKIKSAGTALYYLAGIFAFWGIVSFFIKSDDPEVLAYVLPNIILAVIFLVLGGFSNKKPLACIVSGLFLYVIVQVINAFDDPKTITSGILLKFIIIGYMMKGIKSALGLEKFKKENNLN